MKTSNIKMETNLLRLNELCNIIANYQNFICTSNNDFIFEVVNITGNFYELVVSNRMFTCTFISRLLNSNYSFHIKDNKIFISL